MRERQALFVQWKVKVNLSIVKSSIYLLLLIEIPLALDDKLIFKSRVTCDYKPYLFFVLGSVLKKASNQELSTGDSFPEKADN